MSAGRPLLTLAAAGLGLTGLLAVDMVSTPRDDVGPTAATAPTQPAPTRATPTPQASPAPSGKVVPGSPAGFPAKAVYTGRTGDRRYAVAVAIWNDQAAAYICDGRTVESWLIGSVTAGTATLRNGAEVMTVERTSTGVRISARIAGRRVALSGTSAQKPAGLYRARTANGRNSIGWIVLPDGSQVGVRNLNGSVGPAPELVPGRPVDVGGELLAGAEVTGAAEGATNDD